MLEFYKSFTDWDPFDSSEYYNDLAELYLLQEDKDRVWLEDWDLDVSKGKDAYVTTLGQWSKISRGAFQPSDIKEVWDGEEGPITISFKLNGQDRVIHLEDTGGYIDTGILKEINAMIKASGFQFAEAYNDDDDTIVTVLKAEEQAKLQQERYIDFYFITTD
ncbi:hypothetical protein D3C85_1146130 [compost metagenome]